MSFLLSTNHIFQKFSYLYKVSTKILIVYYLLSLCGFQSEFQLYICVILKKNILSLYLYSNFLYLDYYLPQIIQILSSYSNKKISRLFFIEDFYYIFLSSIIVYRRYVILLLKYSSLNKIQIKVPLLKLYNFI